MASAGAVAIIAILAIGLLFASYSYVATSSNVDSLKSSVSNLQSQITSMDEHPLTTTVTSTSTLTIQTPYYISPSYQSSSSFLSGNPLNIHIGQKVPIATGIADYGVENESGVLSGYTIAASQIMGITTINSMKAYNNTDNSYLATLQLNLDLFVNTTSGTQVFWVQNIGFFQTSSNFMNFNNEIFNSTNSHSALTNDTASGTARDKIVRGTLVSSSGYGTTYSLPFSFDFYTNESIVSDGIRIMMGYQIQRGGPLTQGVYDTILLKIPGVTGAAFTVNGFNPTPTGNFNEIELVFAGPPGAGETTFSSMNSSLDLQYTLLDGSVTAPLSLWEFGSATGEGAYNLQTNLVDGTPTVMIGTVNFYQDYVLG